jgi:hypothetical protein
MNLRIIATFDHVEAFSDGEPHEPIGEVRATEERIHRLGRHEAGHPG